MSKNYYDILQINRNASPEIIDKAYKTLAKKYHPDLQQTEESKKEAEEILKEINEAYEVLSNTEKKANYDQLLKNQDISEEEFQNLYNENQILKDQLKNNQTHNINNNAYNNNNNINNNYQNNTNENYENLYQQEQLRKQREIEYNKQVQQARQKAYHDAYIQDLKNRGYRIKYKKTFKDYVRSLIAIIITIGIFVLICQIPFVKQFFIDIYNQNSIIKAIVDIFINAFT